MAALAWVAAMSPAYAARFVEIPSGRTDTVYYAMLGAIEGGETVEFGRLVSTVAPDKTIALFLNSPGGDLSEGIALGRFLFRSKIATFTLGGGGTCASACAIAFLGGRDRNGKLSRTMLSSSRLGFHQFRPAISGDTRAIRFTREQMLSRLRRDHQAILDIIGFLNDIGESLDKLELMLAAPNEDIRNVSQQEAATLGFNIVDERSNAVTEATNIRARTGQ
jgi:hypothetical protein